MAKDEDTNIYALMRVRRKQYDVCKSIYCPFLKEAVYFNNVGFFHATHNGRGHIRNKADARMRLNLLTCVNDVISNSRHFGDPPRIIPKNDPDNKTSKEIIYYELCYRFNKTKEVAVIIRRVGNGRLHYYSVKYVGKMTKQAHKEPA